MYRIPLFDIDWTLLKGGISNKIHHDAFDFALHTVYNQPTASQNQAMGQGKIDTQILIDTLKLHGATEQEDKSKMPQALEAMKQYFFKNADKGTSEVMPGVASLLSDLKSRNIPLGFLTGNVEAIGWEKLKRAGIADYFSFGAFGSMAYKRVSLIKIAAKEASRILGEEVSVSRLVIVGDSLLDIACARDGGIQIIAVGAGQYKSHELTSADLIIDSLEEKVKIINFLKT